MNDEQPSRRDFVKKLTAMALVGATATLPGCSKSNPNGYVDFSVFKDCDGYDKLKQLSLEFQGLVNSGKENGTKGDFVEFSYNKLKSQTPDGTPLLVLTGPSYNLNGFTVSGSKIEISSKQALAYLVDRALNNDANLFAKPEGSDLPVLRNNNSCGAPVEGKSSCGRK